MQPVRRTKTPLYYAKPDQHIGGAKIYLKREVTIQEPTRLTMFFRTSLACQPMGKKKIIGETGAGQHGVATATARPSLTWNAPSTWVRKRCQTKPSMSSVWSFWELRSRL